MGRIVVVGSQKGGVGKSTIVVSLAAAWAERRRRILLVDADPQGSAATWLDSTDGLEIVRHEGAGLAELLPMAATRADVCVVDLPPGHGEVIADAVSVADVLLVPVGPSPVDIAAAERTLSYSRGEGRPIVRLVLSRTRPWTVLSRTARRALGAYGVPVLRSEITERVAQAEAAAVGRPITVYEPNGRAARDVRALAREVWALGS